VYRDYRESQAVQAQWAETNAGNQAIMRERTRMLEQILQVNGFLPLSQHRILDVGCGAGWVLVGLRQWKARQSIFTALIYCLTGLP
jgi:2-polyprenyl-3-methyl-5-hydroxy-6-metoxy-1,4-benzoquinol methylase